MLITTIIFCNIEFVAHTLFGCMMYDCFRHVDKHDLRTGHVYGYLGFAVIGGPGMYCMGGRIVTATDWAVGIGGVFVLLVGSILIPEGLIKKKENSYYFNSAGL